MNVYMSFSYTKLVQKIYIIFLLSLEVWALEGKQKVLIGCFKNAVDAVHFSPPDY